MIISDVIGHIENFGFLKLNINVHCSKSIPLTSGKRKNYLPGKTFSVIRLADSSHCCNFRLDDPEHSTWIPLSKADIGGHFV